jgi:hypothetical protein
VPFLPYGTIDDDLKVLYGHMAIEIVGVLAPFLSSLEFVITTSAYNMLTLMLDLRFKGLKCVIDFLDHDKTKLLMIIKYDKKIMIPLLVKYNHFLNPHVVGTCTSMHILFLILQFQL